ncbi:hypothetical protein C0995_010625 [Termitomyces sp. Mi166|nr:hypothetical protein C0995_010625 [Termitomyces sp. Mi166\
MHVATHKRDHARIGRNLIPLEARAPAFITLPISIPRIPILGPLITPLIAGTNRPVVTTSPHTHTPARETTVTPAPSISPSPTPTPASDSNGNNREDNGGSNDGSNGGSNDGSKGGSNDGSNGRSNGGSNDGTSTSSSVEGFTSVGTGISTGSSPQPSGASDNPSTGGDGVGNGSSGESTPNSFTSNGSNLNGPIANGFGNVNPTSGSNSGSGFVIGGNADTDTSKATPSSREGFPLSTALPEPNSAANTGRSGSDDVRGELSRGAIAGMVIVITFGLLVVAVILLRGRYRRRRSGRNQWWDRSGTRLSTESDTTSSASLSDLTSIRSSFETSIDHSQTPRLTISFENVPSLPPMAEVRGSNNIQLFSPNSAIPESPVLITFDNSQAPVTTATNNRTSIHSFTSSSSGSHYLVVPSDIRDDRETSSPMSVRPFSPSESFSFPMPPKTQSGDWSSSRPMSTATLPSASRSFNNETVVVPALPSNPFADPSNPFSDPVPPTAEFAEVESIRRPFKGTRHDELTVTIADSVKVLRLFNDGWALVEKLPSFEEILAKEGKNIRRVQGLIPIDCFRAAGQDLSSFFSEKRVSSALYQGYTNSTDAVNGDMK